MGDVMDEIRAEANRRSAAREMDNKRLASQKALLQMDRMPARGQNQSIQRLEEQEQLLPASGNVSGIAGGAARAGDGIRPFSDDDATGDSGNGGEAWPLLDSPAAPAEASTCGPSPENPVQQLLGHLGMRIPSDSSFHPYFRRWFVQDYFPYFSQKLQGELKMRSRSQGFFGSIASQVKGWAMQNMEINVQGDVWYNYVIKNSPMRWGNYCCFRTASVNLGSIAQPCWATFLGLPDANDHWVLPPWAHTDVDCSALLDEVDGRGGISALIASST
eukprot:TRINITY_DN21540_c0_g1_i1.p1 TRINITY_DN21540_c0_g1~~TRINITY_DN21540_c0_g1_i1.p1  ORF type:complete len:274 (-),score=51.10 TRINITY_DN21540_c0_g1_i1:118-939(-)